MRLPEVLRRPTARLFHKWRGFRGHVDGVVDGVLSGWVAPTRPGHGTLRVGVYTPRGVIAETTANIFRDDVAAAGVGNGGHGFAVPLDDVLRKSIAEAGGRVTVRVLEPFRAVLGELKLHPPGETGRPAGAIARPTSLRQALHGDVERLIALFEADATAPRFPPHPPRLAPHRALFERRDHLHPGANLPAPMTAYADYTRYRYKLDAEFDVRRDPEEALHFLMWYLGGYSTLRQGRRVPLSREMIEALNEPQRVPGQRFALTRATWAYLPGVKPISHSVDFANPDWVDWAVYWWSIHQARAMYVEDCLVPESYAGRLARVPGGEAHQPRPLSVFLIRFCAENPAFSGLDLSCEDDRRQLVLAVLLMSVGRPDFLRYIPPATLEALIGRAGSRRTDTPFADFVAQMTGGRVARLSAAAFAHVLRQRGYDLEAGRFLGFTPEGHRLEAARLPAPGPGGDVDIQVIGPFEKASGLGQATRLSAAALRETGYSLNFVDFDLDNPAPEGFSTRTAVSSYRPARVNLLHLNAESVPLAFAYQPDVFSGAYNIGYFFWELDTPAACHYLALDMLDEIWVSTEYGVSIYRPATDKPVVNVGMCVEDVPEIDRADARRFALKKLGLEGDPFIFLTVFDSFSFVQRKNPVGTVKAFLAAFPEGDEDVRLVVKTQNRAKVTDPVQIRIWEEVDALTMHDPRIRVIDETLTYAELLRFKRGCDAFVALHRSEGWGFGMIEAMNIGLPVLCTAYSGNMDFCSDQTAWLVDFEEVELEPDDYIFVRPGQKWAEPDIDHAAQQMRAVWKDPAARAARARAAREKAAREFSAGPIGARYKDRLDEIFRAEGKRSA